MIVINMKTAVLRVPSLGLGEFEKHYSDVMGSRCWLSGSGAPPSNICFRSLTHSGDSVGNGHEGGKMGNRKASEEVGIAFQETDDEYLS